ncbi:MAG: RdgB/HAM1 family non-canonical purine NTP pyrophosphatase [Gemmatimonadaceae bacterium]
MNRARPVLVATRSAGKLRELAGILAEGGMTGVSLLDAGIEESADENAIECHETFEENALAKARYFARLTGLPAISDDSGLCVNALGGAPGVRSKRYSGRSDLTGQALDDANNAKLLGELAGIDDRSASYVCAAAYADEVLERVEVGETRGAITDVPRGSEGFGYDPYFRSAELGVTFGEASTRDKQRVSHRGRAFRALLQSL